MTAGQKQREGSIWSLTPRMGSSGPRTTWEKTELLSEPEVGKAEMLSFWASISTPTRCLANTLILRSLEEDGDVNSGFILLCSFCRKILWLSWFGLKFLISKCSVLGSCLLVRKRDMRGLLLAYAAKDEGSCFSSFFFERTNFLIKTKKRKENRCH